jgi:flavin reductase (DIM6/NTAB) family NADH-FMN oxidoreductase RutF
MTITTPITHDDPTAVSGPAFRRFMRSWATGVAVVTTVAGLPVGCTVNALTSVSLRPPLLLISLGEHSNTLVAIKASGRFAANLLGAGQRHLAERFAAPVEDRFAGVPYRLAHGVPIIDGTIAATVCAVDRTVPAADHVLVLGRPLWCGGDDRPNPAIFFGGGYRTAAPSRADEAP